MSPNRVHTCTRQHSVTSHKIVSCIVSAVGISDITIHCLNILERSKINHCRSRCKGREGPPLIHSFKENAEQRSDSFTNNFYDTTDAPKWERTTHANDDKKGRVVIQLHMVCNMENVRLLTFGILRRSVF
jgi:hypothetical protein